MRKQNLYLWSLGMTESSQYTYPSFIYYYLLLKHLHSALFIRHKYGGPLVSCATFFVAATFFSFPQLFPFPQLYFPFPQLFLFPQLFSVSATFFPFPQLFS